jgi:hypothetical protein
MPAAALLTHIAKIYINVVLKDIFVSTPSLPHDIVHMRDTDPLTILLQGEITRQTVITICDDPYDYNCTHGSGKTVVCLVGFLQS